MGGSDETNGSDWEEVVVTGFRGCVSCNSAVGGALIVS